MRAVGRHGAARWAFEAAVAVAVTAAVMLPPALVAADAPAVLVNEVADKGSTSGPCEGRDWVELFNPSETGAVNMTAWVLHDDKGAQDEDAFTFARGTAVAVIGPGEYTVLCNKGDDAAVSPQFGIGGDDTVTLVDADGNVVSTSGELGDEGVLDLTWARNDEGGFEYTATPTPGAANEITEGGEPVDYAAVYAAQAARGEEFFASPPVVDVRVTMEEADLTFMDQHVYFETWQPWSAVTVVSGGEEIARLTSAGRIRPKGQSTMAFPACLSMDAYPFVLDFDTTNASQTLFGIERAYMRTHMSDPSFMREWSMHRMLQRFGLPYLRTRTVRLFINDAYRGTYTMMEAPDQDYVFARSFPESSADVGQRALYKFKTHAIGCGLYGEDEIEDASPPGYPNPAPDYAFVRGEHREPIYTKPTFEQCFAEFTKMLQRERRDTIAAWLSHDRDCGRMLVEVGLVDRDLGPNNGHDDAMTDFVNEFLAYDAATGCGDHCNETLAAMTAAPAAFDVDQVLKNLAVYAVTLGQDSPLGNLNNWYIAHSPLTSAGYKIVQYDHNNVAERGGLNLCDPWNCADRAVYWSIARPTCKALSTNPVAGPLLTDPVLFDRYVEFVRDFTDNVYTDESFLAEMQAHAEAIRSAVEQDVWAPQPTGSYANEITGDPEDWQQFYLLSVMRKRGQEVKTQLAAIDDGTFPRFDADTGEGEPCSDWRITPEEGRGGMFQLGDACSEEALGWCRLATMCFIETPYGGCSSWGTLIPACEDTSVCEACFPESPCGVGGPGDDESGSLGSGSSSEGDDDGEDGEVVTGAGGAAASLFATAAVLVAAGAAAAA